ncbi:serine/threonine kinase-like domain-containing protein STKLD1 isoform X1 [Polypterus senegalus]|uniref:serine/threonine kinase-like domain-containing protein STKLD1 isoform X1 n=2 Tax=Polypterus senegalus TaxID=55291 RepID=UPI0019632AC4|nr:serine/threonine kinase-like domain-containing protein STKLD1 isoform X1 [Polypterus senegalus]
MEKYEILDKKDAGAYGYTFIVKNRRNDQIYTMKRVECRDEGEANKALRESLCLLELQHSNVIGYKEVFMIWDPKISSVIVCLVMDCCAMSSLSDLIRTKRKQEDKFDEAVIRKWLGQLIDALVYLHKQNIIHRNLKPSNILLMPDQSFAIFDFNVACLADDEQKLKVRMKENKKSWMAPESVTCYEWSEKSDVWSLGCIILEMLTLTLLNEDAAMSLLQRIREDSGLLKSSLDSLGCSHDLCQLLMKILEKDPDQRPTALDLVYVPYVKECLLVCGSPLSGLKKRLPFGITGAPCEEGQQAVLEFMQKYFDVEEAQISGLRFFLEADQAAFAVTSQFKDMLMSLMKNHADSPEVHLEACRVLYQLSVAALERGLEKELLHSPEVISCILKAIRSYSTEIELLILALNICMILSENEDAALAFGKLGGVQDLLNVMRTFPDNVEICRLCCRTLWGLVLNKNNARIACAEGAVDTLCSIGEAHLLDGGLMESMCSALWSLTLQGNITEGQYEKITSLLLDAIKNHLSRQAAVKNACSALASLVSASELSAAHILLCIDGSSGAQLLKEIYTNHSDDPEVVENVCSVLNEICQYGDLAMELAAQKFKTMLNEIKEKFASNKEIIDLAEAAALKMQE